MPGDNYEFYDHQSLILLLSLFIIIILIINFNYDIYIKYYCKSVLQSIHYIIRQPISCTPEY